MNELERILHELVLNWKLRLFASALFSLLGLSFLIGSASGFIADLTVWDQTIVGIAVFIVTLPIYLIIADLPKIDGQNIVAMLNERVPEFKQQAGLVLKEEADLNEEEKKELERVKLLYKTKSLHTYLPARPMKQAVLLMLTCLILTAVAYFYFM